MSDDLNSIFECITEVQKYIRQNNCPDADVMSKENIVELNNIFGLFANRSVRRLLYVLHNTLYSNLYEIELLCNVHHYSIFNYLKKLKDLGIVQTLPKKSKEYRLFSSFWKAYRPRSMDGNIFYYIESDFVPVIDKFIPLLQSEFRQSEISELDDRRNAWLSHKKVVQTQRNAAEMANKNALGFCSNPTCKTLIMVGMVDGKDYFQFGRNHRLCRSCFLGKCIDDKTIIRWKNEK